MYVYMCEYAEAGGYVEVEESRVEALLLSLML